MYQFVEEGISTTMSGDPQEAYLDYLEPQIGGSNHQTFWELVTIMYRKEFVWLVPNDDNRVADGLDIRVEWFENMGDAVELGPCSFLEVLIGLSRRMSFITDESSEGWAWQLITNLKLHKMQDPISRYKELRIEEILEAVIWRTYDLDGSGGFFPLLRPEKDQRETEIWYQMSAYVKEIDP